MTSNIQNGGLKLPQAMIRSKIHEITELSCNLHKTLDNLRVFGNVTGRFYSRSGLMHEMSKIVPESLQNQQDSAIIKPSKVQKYEEKRQKIDFCIKTSV